MDGSPNAARYAASLPQALTSRGGCSCALRNWLPYAAISAVQTDVRMPKRHLQQLEDAYFNSTWQAAIEAAVQVGRKVACRIFA